ncbi:aminoacyl-tRNA hydrolase [Mycoplasmopsis opalescens]|uniref:aminoacyl-tRNA hydrolase n=1 Tax=Mycoplasmopsis opalescens TaxID=114886 RepID=UPI0004A77BE1|nr:aminoacyl-tRNA hydrolase [Mycoplasmopsis opalescens]
MKLIVGLGNPGEEYKFTRHNSGFLVIDKICEKLNITLNKNRFNGEFTTIDGAIIAKPLTFMNKSGDFIIQIANYYKINSDDIMVIYDDKDFKIGQASIKIGGSAANHNGILNIMEHFKSNDFKKLRIGIGAPTSPMKDYVLSNFKNAEMARIEMVFEKAADAAISFVYNDIRYIMEKFNGENRKAE